MSYRVGRELDRKANREANLFAIAATVSLVLALIFLGALIFGWSL